MGEGEGEGGQLLSTQEYLTKPHKKKQSFKIVDAHLCSKEKKFSR